MLKGHICVLAATVLMVGACGSDGDSEDGDASASTDEASTDDEAETAADAETPDAQDVEEAVDDIVDGLEEVQASEGGGGATFTANGETWEFPSVLCAFGEDEIGQPGAVFNMSAIADGLQLYVSIDDSGAAHSLSLNDVEDFENPSVSLSVDPFIAGSIGALEEFLALDGKQVTANVVMIDDITGEPTSEPARLSAICP